MNNPNANKVIFALLATILILFIWFFTGLALSLEKFLAILVILALIRLWRDAVQ